VTKLFDRCQYSGTMPGRLDVHPLRRSLTFHQVELPSRCRHSVVLPTFKTGNLFLTGQGQPSPPSQDQVLLTLLNELQALFAAQEELNSYLFCVA